MYDWINDLEMLDFNAAKVSLIDLGNQEARSLEMKKVYFSIAQLSHKASGENDVKYTAVFEAEVNLA